MALRADERRDKLRKAMVRSKYPLIHGFLNGETYMSKPHVSYDESIVIRREPGELKHLSNRRKRKKTSISKVAASEMERAQTEVRALRGSDCRRNLRRIVEWSWKDQSKRVKVPYTKRKVRRQYPEYHETRETLWE